MVMMSGFVLVLVLVFLAVLVMMVGMLGRNMLNNFVRFCLT